MILNILKNESKDYETAQNVADEFVALDNDICDLKVDNIYQAYIYISFILELKHT